MKPCPNCAELLEVAEMAWSLLQDLVRNNPKLLTRVRLSEPKRFSEAILRLPIAIENARNHT